MNSRTAPMIFLPRYYALYILSSFECGQNWWTAKVMGFHSLDHITSNGKSEEIFFADVIKVPNQLIFN